MVKIKAARSLFCRRIEMRDIFSDPATTVGGVEAEKVTFRTYPSEKGSKCVTYLVIPPRPLVALRLKKSRFGPIRWKPDGNA